MKGFSPWPGRVSTMYYYCETVKLQSATTVNMSEWPKFSGKAVVERPHVVFNKTAS
jgi:hypothetical protein